MLEEERCWRACKKCPKGKEFLRGLYSWSEDNPLNPMLVWKVCDPCHFGTDYRSDYSPEAFDRLRSYVQKKLLDSGVIPEHEANPVDPYSLAARIVGDAWRQQDPYYFADLDIARAVRFPPDPIDRGHFSLKAYAKLKK